MEERGAIMDIFNIILWGPLILAAIVEVIGYFNGEDYGRKIKQEVSEEFGDGVLYAFRHQIPEAVGIRDVFNRDIRNWVVLEDKILQYYKGELEAEIKKVDIEYIDSDITNIIIKVDDDGYENPLNFYRDGKITIEDVNCFPEVLGFLENWIKS